MQSGKKKGFPMVSSLARENLQQLADLTEELHKSRIAVEYIGSKSRVDNKSEQRVDQIREELKSIILLLKKEEKRQLVLRELVSVLTGEMNKIKMKENEINEREQMEMQKSLSQIREGIDMILLKKNHEVAKIADLKEKASQSRSERVVFSNLFKKIEKEIKEHQEVYKNSILISQNHKFSLETADQKSKSKTLSLMKQIAHPHSSTPYNSGIPQKNTEMSCPNSIKIRVETSFVPDSECELRKDLGTKKEKVETEYLREEVVDVKRKNKRTKSNNKFGRYNSRRNIYNIESSIHQLEEFVDRIKTAVGVASVSEITDLMNSSEENEALTYKIGKIEQSIEDMQKNIEDLEVATQFNRLTEDYGQFEESNAIESTLSGFKFLQEMKQHNQSRYNYMHAAQQVYGHPRSVANFQQLGQLSEILGISANELHPQTHSDPYSNLSTAEFLEKCHNIDNVVNQILQEDDKVENAQIWESNASKDNRHFELGQLVKVENKDRKMDKRDSGELSLIMSIMTKNGNPEKLFDRRGFFAEYQNEVKTCQIILNKSCKNRKDKQKNN